MPSLLDRITSVDKLDVTSRRVLVRADLDAPLSGDGKVRDDAKVRAALAALRVALDSLR